MKRHTPLQKLKAIGRFSSKSFSHIRSLLSRKDIKLIDGMGEIKAIVFATFSLGENGKILMEVVYVKSTNPYKTINSTFQIKSSHLIPFVPCMDYRINKKAEEIFEKEEKKRREDRLKIIKKELLEG